MAGAICQTKTQRQPSRIVVVEEEEEEEEKPERSLSNSFFPARHLFFLWGGGIANECYLPTYLPSLSESGHTVHRYIGMFGARNMFTMYM